jgi:hypothetical protein
MKYVLLHNDLVLQIHTFEGINKKKKEMNASFANDIRRS